MLRSHCEAVSLSGSCLLRRNFLAQQASVFSHPADSQQHTTDRHLSFCFFFFCFFLTNWLLQCRFYRSCILWILWLLLLQSVFICSVITVMIGFAGESRVWTCKDQIQITDECSYSGFFLNKLWLNCDTPGSWLLSAPCAATNSFLIWWIKSPNNPQTSKQLFKDVL